MTLLEFLQRRCASRFDVVQALVGFQHQDELRVLLNQGVVFVESASIDQCDVAYAVLGEDFLAPLRDDFLREVRETGSGFTDRDSARSLRL